MRRVLTDPRGYLASIRDIHAILKAQPCQEQRVTLLTQWNPHELHGRRVGALLIPEFREAADKLLALFDPAGQEQLSDCTDIGCSFHSRLYENVLNDARGSVAAITDLHEVLQNATDRKQALEDWKPHTHPQSDDVRNP